MTKSCIFLVGSVVIVWIGYVFVVLFGISDYHQQLSGIQGYTITSGCTSTQDLLIAKNCGDTGKCWSWCHDQNTLAQSLSQATGKWCYTTGSSKSEIESKTCSLDNHCTDQVKCLSQCSVGCWKPWWFRGQNSQNIEKKVKNTDQSQL